jgi:DNA-binding MarR family transcriptional regulator
MLIMFAVKQLASKQEARAVEKREEVLRELKILINKVNRCAEASMPRELKCQLTESQGRTLGFLYHNRDRDVFQRDVEAEFSITRATASKMLSAMEQSGLITRCGVAGDARLKKIALTDRAMAHMKQLRPGMRQFERQLTRGMTEEEQETLVRLLRMLQRNADSIKTGKE